MDNRTPRTAPVALFVLLQCWVVISALYYVGFIFLGDLDAGHGKFLVHKATKYIVAGAVSSAFLWYERNLRTLLFSLLGLLGVSIFVLLEPESIRHLDLVLVLLSMGGFIGVLGMLSAEQQQRLEGVVVLSAALVGVVALYEWHFHPGAYGEFWKIPGNSQLIASLYNPNNLGVYQAACVIMLVFGRMPLGFKLLLTPFILFALFMSGSRTAWLALLIVLGGAVLLRFKRISLSKAMLYGLIGLSLAAVVIGLASVGQLSVPQRLSDFESALIRLDRYQEFLAGLNEGYWVPDLNGVRSGLVNESAYLTLLNSLGGAGVAAAALLALLLLTVRRTPTACLAWKLVFLYYLLTACFENILNSFPNNQMLFISAGAYFVFRKTIVQGKCDEQS